MCAMKYDDFIYADEPVPKIEIDKHKDFIMHFQKSMLLSLVKRKLLTHEQMERVIAELEKRHRKIKS